MFEMKHLLRSLLAHRWVNPAARLAARALPARLHRRIPVNVPHVKLGLDGCNIVLTQPHRCLVAQEVFWGKGQLHGDQDRNALKAAIALSRNASTFLDIGSYTGLFALAVARTYPDIDAFAYEIVGENYLLLWENVLENDLYGRVQPLLVAVGAENRSIRIPFRQSSGQLASSVDISWSTDHGVQVPVRRLDELHLGSPGPVALKIDVEGFEMDVFDGAREFLAKHRPDMVCEVLRRAQRVPEMMELLRGLGYRWFHIRENGFALRPAIVPDKLRRDWLLTCRSDQELLDLGLELVA